MLTNQVNTQKNCAGCGSPSASGPCGSNGTAGLERTRFFPRQLVTPDDLTQDQVYFRDKHRRHNRLLHGWGVVCGARCQWKAGDCTLTIESGYILGPYGDEIVIPDDQVIDICKQDLNGNTYSPCGEASDPWCKDVRATRKAGQTYYLAVRYEECQSRPVAVPSGACGCTGDQCEYTRTRDSFVFQVLNELPASYRQMTQPNLTADILRCNPQGNGRSCPPCPEDPWVILADLKLAADGSLAGVDCFAHRRYVISFADYFYLCGDNRLTPGLNNQYNMLAPQAVLVDTRAQAAGQTASTAAAVRLANGAWTTLPVNFSVTPGQTVAQLLAEEGSREYFDSTTGDTYTLSELYALAGVKPETVLNSAQDAVTPLEGLTLDVAGMRVVRDSVGSLLADSGQQALTTDHLGNPAAAAGLAATSLAGVDPASKLGKAVANQTISEVAALPQEDFVKTALTGVAAAQKAAAEAQARLVWNNASRVAKLAARWKPG